MICFFVFFLFHEMKCVLKHTTNVKHRFTSYTNKYVYSFLPWCIHTPTHSCNTNADWCNHTKTRPQFVQSNESYKNKSSAHGPNTPTHWCSHKNKPPTCTVTHTHTQNPLYIAPHSFSLILSDKNKSPTHSFNTRTHSHTQSHTKINPYLCSHTNTCTHANPLPIAPIHVLTQNQPPKPTWAVTQK